MTLDDAGQWSVLRALVAELLDLAPAERAARLATLPPDLAVEAGALLAGAEGELPDRFERGIAGFAGALLADWERMAADGGAAEASTLAGAVLGAWRLERLLGRGGMAEVWEAHRVAGDFEQVVAVKLLKRGMDSDEIVGRFLRERQILARLDHPGIARLFDGGLAPDGRPYFVLEKVDGEPITDWCEKRALPVPDRLRLLIACCEAVASAHRLLVVHRDLKPSNILVTGGGIVKLLDFGIAKLLEDDATADATRTEHRLLTPAYAAPEQIVGEPVSTATDVYALGVLAYELLTGRLPHRRRAADLAGAVASEVIERPSTALLAADDAEPGPGGATPRDRRRRSRALEGDLDTIVLTALRREPERRYATTTAFADDLRRHLEGRPIAARRDRVGYRLRKFVGRHRWAVVLSTVALLALVAALAAALVQARRAEREAVVARQQATRAERVRAFLASVFEVSDPVRARGEEVTARALLAAGVRRVDGELASDPELRAEMLDLLAGLYRKLGGQADARPLAERSLSLRVASRGPESAEAARSEWTLGWILVGQGEFAPARKRLEHAIAVLERVEGPDSLAAADAREPLMDLVFGADGPQAALPVVEQRLAIYRRVLGERDPKTAVALSDLGTVLYQLGRKAEAEKALRGSAVVLDAVLPADDPRAAYPHSNLAGLLAATDRAAEAEVEVGKAIAIRVKALGPAHADTLNSRGQLTKILMGLGRLADAERNTRESLALAEGGDPFIATQLRATLGQVLLRAERFGEALATLDQAIAERRTLLPEDHILMLISQVNRARALAGLERRAEARALLDRLIPKLEAKGPEGTKALEGARETRAKLEG